MIVAVAGMEGALPSVIAGMTDCPIIGVPTSTGYGAGAGGKAALLAGACVAPVVIAIIPLFSSSASEALVIRFIIICLI